jgi:hypothetical protein
LNLYDYWTPEKFVRRWWLCEGNTKGYCLFILRYSHLECVVEFARDYLSEHYFLNGLPFGIVEN